MTGTVATLALLGARTPTGTATVHAVMGWAGRHAVLAACPHRPKPAAAVQRVAPAVEQLTLPLGDLSAPTSSGLTWATWSLPSIPTDLRHLPLADAAAAVATRVGTVAA